MADKKADDKDKAARRQAALAGDAGGPGAMAPQRGPSGGRRAAAPPPPMEVDHAALGAAVAAAVGAMNKQRALTEPTPDLDRTVPGGCYVVDGVCVNAHGELIEMPMGDADEAIDDWLDAEAERHAPTIAQATIGSKEAEEEAGREPTEAERQAQSLNQARLDAADAVRKRAEEAAQQLANPPRDAARDDDKKSAARPKGKE
jgi:hypothetical protein